MSQKKFLEKYFSDVSKLSKNLSEKYNNDIIKIANLFKKISKNKNKVIFLGNGGSASICSHVSVDLTKNSKIRSINFNEPDLITCFSNDFGHENWMKEALNSYYDKGDLVLMISVSGNSPNLVNAAKFCKKNKIKLISITGSSFYNNLNKINNNGINIWINSKSYNQVEIGFNIILLSIVDLIIGKKIYPA